MKINDIELTLNEKTHSLIIGIPPETFNEIIPEVIELIKKKKEGIPIVINIKEKSYSRSLDANALLWSVLSQMAVKLNTSKEELYLHYIREYGFLEIMAVKPEAVHELQKNYKIVEFEKEIKVDGEKLMQMICYRGSSTYDRQEFAYFLEMIIQDAKEMGITILTKEEIEILNKALNKN